jgi:hypothetical protein
MSTEHTGAPFCQSCGLPLQSDADKGTEAGGVKSAEFCSLCYHEGSFLEPDITLEEMADRVAAAMAEERDMPKEAARAMVDGFIHHLKRWRTPGIEESLAPGSATREA